MLLNYVLLLVATAAAVSSSDRRNPHVQTLPARQLPTVQYAAFTQTATFSIANQLGYFQKVGINAKFNQIGSSPDGFAAVQNGTYDILSGTIDNDVNFVFNQGAPITVLGQLDQGADLVLASTHNITCISQLKGKNLIVDAATSGFAFILQDILSQNGLQFGTDYNFTAVGGTNQRFNFLTNGSLSDGSPVFATILVYPFTAMLQQIDNSTRPNILARASQYSDLNPLSSSAFTVASSTVPCNSSRHDSAVRFLTAMLAANRFLACPENSAASINAIASQINVSSAIAQAEYTAATDPTTGETTSMQGGVFNVSTQGLINVINVRNNAGGLDEDVNTVTTEATTPGPGQLIDYSLRDEAVAMLDRYGLGS
ncbi:MAG: hypothetical protein Q9227_001129 [Pyrenula ochraceoflavens]